MNQTCLSRRLLQSGIKRLHKELGHGSRVVAQLHPHHQLMARTPGLPEVMVLAST